MSVAVVILSWNELSVTRDSVWRLLKEPEVSTVIVVDNGSTDGSKEYFRSLRDNDKFGFIDLPKNAGISVARNLGITMVREELIFLLDGDILYVPGTIKEYAKILEANPDAFCVGQNSFELVMQNEYNGTIDPLEADLRMTEDYVISDWFPMAWTQYGLFRADLLKKQLFIETPPFNEPGYGFEDDWLFHEMREQGYISLSVNKPLYYHQAHTGLNELKKEGLDTKQKEREKLFKKRWGRRSQWSEWLADNQPEKTTRPKP